MKFAPGEVLVRRHWRGGRVTLMHVVRVAADDEQGLRLWLPVGLALLADRSRRRSRRTMTPPSTRCRARLARLHVDRQRRDDLDAGRPSRTRSAGSGPTACFAGWYVNLEEPYVRWADRGCAGVDTRRPGAGRDRAAGPLVAVAGRGRVPRPDRPPAVLDRRLRQPRSGPPATGWSGSPRRASSRSTAPGAASGPTRPGPLPALPPGHDRPRATRLARLTSSSCPARADACGVIRAGPAGLAESESGCNCRYAVSAGPLPGRVRRRPRHQSSGPH